MITQPVKIGTGIIVLTTVYGVLSLLDGSLTLLGLSLGVIEEANPIMKLLVSKSIALFLVVKLMIPFLVGLFCWMIHDKRPLVSVLVLWLAVAVYSLVTLAHVYWLTITVSVLV